MNTKEFQHFTIAFPDEGAYLRFSTMFPKQDQVICAKVELLPSASRKRLLSKHPPAHASQSLHLRYPFP